MSASNLFPPLSYPIIHLEWSGALAAAASQMFSSSLLYPGETEEGRETEGGGREEGAIEDQGQMNFSLNDEGSVCK